MKVGAQVLIADGDGEGLSGKVVEVITNDFGHEWVNVEVDPIIPGVAEPRTFRKRGQDVEVFWEPVDEPSAGEVTSDRVEELEQQLHDAANQVIVLTARLDEVAKLADRLSTVPILRTEEANLFAAEVASRARVLAMTARGQLIANVPEDDA